MGLKDLLAAEGITNCVELDWWETRKIKAPAGEVEVTLLPARHWSARSLFDKNCTLWGSFAARTSQGNYYFAGDTAYCDRLFAAIGRRFGPFDLSLLPIGAYRPRVVHRNSHCDPREAVLMHNELRSKRSLAIHWVSVIMLRFRLYPCLLTIINIPMIYIFFLYIILFLFVFYVYFRAHLI